MLKAVIFDMDGVLIDSELIHYEMAKRVMEQYGAALHKEDMLKFLGISNDVMWAYLVKKYNITENISVIIEKQDDITIKYIKESNMKPIPGIKELLLELHEKQILMAIASSSSKNLICTIVNKLGISDYFTAFVSAEDAVKGKPHPDIFIDAARLLNVSPDQCLAIEDTGYGLKAAVEAGMKCVGYFNKNSGNQDLTMADLVVNNFADLHYETIAGLFKGCCTG